MGPVISPEPAADAVLAVLAGTPLHMAAARAYMDPADLADAVTLYQAAGRTALDTQAHATGRCWHQVSIEFPDWRFNLRSSNTEPLLRLNVESRGDEKLMQEKTAEIAAMISV